MNKWTDIPPLLQKYLYYKEVMLNHSAQTIQEYYYDIRRFLRYTFLNENNPSDSAMKSCDISHLGKDYFQSLTKENINQYLLWLTLEQGVKATSRKRKIAAITMFFRYLKEEEGLSIQIDKIPLPKVGARLPQSLSMEEIEELLHGIQGKHQTRNYAMILLFLTCGLRVSELVQLDKGDMQDDTLRVIGKGNQERLLYLPQETQDAIHDYLQQRNDNLAPLFVSQKKQRISKIQVQKMVGNAVESAGLDRHKYTTHKLRHTAATQLLRAGVNIRVVQEILGHKNLNTTQIYTHVSSEDLKKASQVKILP